MVGTGLEPRGRLAGSCHFPSFLRPGRSGRGRREAPLLPRSDPWTEGSPGGGTGGRGDRRRHGPGGRPGPRAIPRHGAGSRRAAGLLGGGGSQALARAEPRQSGNSEDPLRGSGGGGPLPGAAEPVELVMKRLFVNRSGQSMVEFALVVVMLLLLVVGICEFGRAWNLYQILANAAREGARLSSLASRFHHPQGVHRRDRSSLHTAN